MRVYEEEKGVRVYEEEKGVKVYEEEKEVRVCGEKRRNTRVCYLRSSSPRNWR